MTDSIVVKVVNLGRVVDVTLPTGGTIRQAANEAGVSDELSARYLGNNVAANDWDFTSLSNGDTVVFTPPALKHG